MDWREREVRGVILPEQPTFDKVAAMYVLLYALDLREPAGFPMRFYGVDIQDSTLQSSINEGFYPLDVGSNKYQHRGTGSALETVVRDFDLDPTVDESLARLIEVVNRNNQTGYLKSRPQSLVWAIREAYKVGEDRGVVVTEMLNVVDVWFRTTDGEPLVREWPEASDFRTLDEVLPYLKDTTQELTLGWYVRQKFELGDLAGEIRDRAKWWLRVFRSARKAEKKTAEDLEFTFRKEFEILDGLPAVVVESDDQRAGRQLIRQRYAVVVVRRKSGNVAVLSNQRSRLDMSQVAIRLNELDTQRGSPSGIWFYDERIQAVLNGSFSWRQPATRLSIEEIIEVIQRKIRCLPRRPRR